MIGRAAVLIVCLGFAVAAAPVSASDSPQPPEFVQGETGCLRLEGDYEAYSTKALVDAQYRWLSENHPGYRFKKHAKPKPQYLRKLGCETQRGSILTVETKDGQEVTVCFCLPAKESAKPVPSGAG